MSNPEDYTVGWICTIEPEYLAAQLCLDETHPSLTCHPSLNDTNTYVLGKLSDHNVVIACLPSGSYGISSAANVATNMLRSFPNVRIGLMVGIGGGAPTLDNDIRLGDIVVSSPGDGKGGVFQHDFGRNIQEQDFQETGFLNRPPTTLLTAVMNLRVKYRRDPSSLEKAINRVLGKEEEELREELCRPDASTDTLYRSNFVHPAGSKTLCVGTCDVDSANVVPRPERKRVRSPVVHYGLIASGNRLMKDVLHRDELAEKLKVLCFEMEAAGLMNDFPCLVVRGICDYSDSHKNKVWQVYAALVASVYAKDLLRQIPPNKVEAEKRIAEVLSAVACVQEVVNELGRGQHNQENSRILNWLTPVDYGPQQSDYLRRRQPETGQWLLDSEEYQAWLKTSKQTLFCPGIPGAGKTILTSIMVDDLITRFRNDPTISIAYIYLTFGGKTSRRLTTCYVKDLYDRHKIPIRDFQSADQVWGKHLCDVKVHPGNNRELYRDLLEIRASEEDVRRYLDGNISQLPRFVGRSTDLQEEIKAGIVKAVGGMFLLAQLHLDSLRGKRSPKALRTALKKLATGSDAYDHAYKDAMERIGGQLENQQELAKDVHSWITCAKRPLTMSELQHALAVEAGKSVFDKENLPQIEDMVSVCAGLVTVDEASNIIRLVHYTTQEYFQRTQNHWFPMAESTITTICVTYLSFSVFESGFCQTDTDFEDRLRSNPLYNYAAHNWGHHARASSAEVEQLVVNLLESETKASSCSQAMTYRSRYSVYTQAPKQVTSVHLAAYFGLEEIMLVLFRHGHDPDIKDSYGRTPLSWAAKNGHEAVVKLLLERGVRLETKDTLQGRTPLSYTAGNGHEAVVKLLLERGAELETKDTRGWTPLLYAAWNGHEAVVKLLLERGAELETKCTRQGQTPLSYAAGNGHEVVVTLLLERGAGLDTEDTEGWTPLSWAAYYGQEAVVKLLQDKCAVTDPVNQQLRRKKRRIK